MFKKANWIKPAEEFGDVVPLFFREFKIKDVPQKATLTITGMGNYEANINGVRISDYVLAPGWTSYEYRLQVQQYDITEQVKENNKISIILGKGWYRSPLFCIEHNISQQKLMKEPSGLIAEIKIEYRNGSEEYISTDESWKVEESALRFSEIYDGEIYDATFHAERSEKVVCFNGPSHTLILQQGPIICENEKLVPMHIFTTPLGEKVIDFGQEITGFLELIVTAKKDDIIDVSFAEVLTKEGNFYTENYRSAKCLYHYICKEGEQTFKTKLSFYGFRYIRINEFPGGTEAVTKDNFRAIVVHSKLERTGYFNCSNLELNKLFSNIIWGQKGNFLDVPTDCPQRDERCGWTGDAQVFVRTACLNYDVEKFFEKWFGDLRVDQKDDGNVSYLVPDIGKDIFLENASAAWGDAAVVCPWEVYLAYGNLEILEAQYESMCKWISYITKITTTPYLWTGGVHYGDWLGLDAPSGSYKGASREDLIASAYYAYSTNLVIKAGKALGKNVLEYEMLYKKIVQAFRKEYPEYYTQTEYALAIYFGLAEDIQKSADCLAKMVEACGTKLQTGFVGTPYLLHALSSHGYVKLAYSLLLRREYPSWLYPVTKGATTIWEHWDGIMDDGGFWSSDMNSYNHYAYGAVADWLYGVAVGITPLENAPGYAKVKVAPNPDRRLDWLQASVITRYGTVSSKWSKDNEFWRYEITTPVEAEIVVDGKSQIVSSGTHLLFSKIEKE